MVEAFAGEDLGTVEEVEEARHAALVHGPLVVLRAGHRHHLLPPSVSLRFSSVRFSESEVCVAFGWALWVPRSAPAFGHLLKRWRVTTSKLL